MDTDTVILGDILAKIVARMSACRSACHENNFRKSRVWDVSARILARMPVSVLVSVSASWNASLTYCVTEILSLPCSNFLKLCSQISQLSNGLRLGLRLCRQQTGTGNRNPLTGSRRQRGQEPGFLLWLIGAFTSVRLSRRHVIITHQLRKSSASQSPNFERLI